MRFRRSAADASISSQPLSAASAELSRGLSGRDVRSPRTARPCAKTARCFAKTAPRLAKTARVVAKSARQSR